MDYVTYDGVVLRTGYTDTKYWYILTVKEFLNNAVDSLWKHYKGAANAAVNVEITKNDKVIRIKVSNTNDKDIQVFQDKDLILNYEMRYGSKQNEYIISTGMLGDALKQILAFGYVLIHMSDDDDDANNSNGSSKNNSGNGFKDRQWEHPLIIRHNKQEYKIWLYVDKPKEEIQAEIVLSKDKVVSTTNTEIQVTLPVVGDLDMKELIDFCKFYPLFTTDISFKFRLIDNSMDQEHKKLQQLQQQQEQQYQQYYPSSSSSRASKTGMAKELVKVLSSPEPKAAVVIQYPALHPISTEWNNISSVHYYRESEFLNRLVRVHNKSVYVYDVLRTFREGTNISRDSNPDHDLTIGELIAHPDRDKKVEKLYYALKRAIPTPPHELSLPYKNTNKVRKIREKALIERLCSIYSNSLNQDKAVYKIVSGHYHHEQSGGLYYPFVFEVLAIPYSKRVLDLPNEGNVASMFVGMVNYSLSPRGNSFEGTYVWKNMKDKYDLYDMTAHTAREMLNKEGFEYYSYSSPKTKIPTIIMANLISPRIDYHGHDKSRVDARPFIPTIIEALQKISKGIQTFRGAGYTFSSDRHHDTARANENKVGTKEALKELLMQIRRGEV